MKIIIPIAGAEKFENSDYIYPKPIIDINDKPLIEYVISNLSQIEKDHQFVFILKDSLCTDYNIDFTIRQLTEDPVIIKLKNPTKGAVCTALMAIDKILPEEEVIIVNSDQYFKKSISPAIDFFRTNKAEGGLITFSSVHPRWSFAMVDQSNNVLQTAEKRPISKNAIAGFYYYNKFQNFIDAASNSVLNEDSFNGNIYLSSTINQLILQNKRVIHYNIDNEDFISFYTPQKLKEFERLILNK
jgi:NDP-sugar pyrophosphorylase family protein